MRKVIISVAPVNAAPHHIDPTALAEEIIACEKAGAAMVHLHIRDENGLLTDNVEEYTKVMQKVREKSNIVLQASTGGVSNLTIEQRCAPLYLPFVETCSLNVGSVNLGTSVYQNPIEDVETCVKTLIAQKKYPEIEVFEIGMIHTVAQLAEKYALPRPILMNIVLGHQGESPATPLALTTMWNFLPRDSFWGFTHAYRQNFSLMAAALGLGASLVRIGFEDSNLLPDREAENNVVLVEELVLLIHAIGLEVATPDEARQMMGLENRC